MYFFLKRKLNNYHKFKIIKKTEIIKKNNKLKICLNFYKFLKFSLFFKIKRTKLYNNLN